ncbi:MAG TPA: hypothetical protein VGJ05_20545 [Fimbriiglobus sp.]
MYATGQPFADIDRLLLSVEAGHVGQRTPHHATGGRTFRWLGNGDERQVVFRLQPFEFDVIEKIAGRPVHLVKEQAVEEAGVFLCVGNEFAERLAFIALTGRLGNAEQFVDFAASLRRVSPQGVFLHFEAEAFAFLFPTANPCQRDESFHGDHPEDKA